MKPTSSQRRRLSMAVIGTGNWGRNWVRVISELDDVDLTWIVDPSPSALEAAHRIAPEAAPVPDVGLTNYEFEAAVICTPSTDHFERATTLLSRRKDLLVEKPLAMSARAALQLTEQATTSGAVLMVGHQLLYHPLFTRLEEMVTGGAIGKLRSISAKRTGLVNLEREPGVIWSYGPHDISMILSLIKAPPISVDVTGRDGAAYPGLPLIADIDLRFEEEIRVAIHLDASQEQRSRKLSVVGTRGELSFDDSRAGGTLTHHVNAEPNREGRTIGVDGDEPLVGECRHFIECAIHRIPPLSGTEHALQVMQVLERANASFSAPA